MIVTFEEELKIIELVKAETVSWFWLVFCLKAFLLNRDQLSLFCLGLKIRARPFYLYFRWKCT